MIEDSYKQAVELLIRVADSGILFPHDLELDADICNFLIGRRPKATKGNQMDKNLDSLD